MASRVARFCSGRRSSAADVVGDSVTVDRALPPEVPLLPDVPPPRRWLLRTWPWINGDIRACVVAGWAVPVGVASRRVIFARRSGGVKGGASTPEAPLSRSKKDAVPCWAFKGVSCGADVSSTSLSPSPPPLFSLLSSRSLNSSVPLPTRPPSGITRSPALLPLTNCGALSEGSSGLAACNPTVATGSAPGVMASNPQMAAAAAAAAAAVRDK